MTSDDFLRLRPDSIIEMNEKTYRCLETDALGRVKLIQRVYFIDDFDYNDDCYDTYEECEDALEQIVNESEDEDINGSDFDIEECDCGNEFWMHYKDMEDAYLI